MGTGDGLRVLDGPDPSWPDGPVTALAPGPDGPWAIADGHRLLRRSGHGWDEVAVVEDLRAICLLPTPQGTYVGTSEAHLLLARDGGVRRVGPFDRVDGRDAWYTPWGGPPDVRSMASDAAGVLHVNVHVGGIPRSADGETWEPTIDIHADVHQVVADEGRVLAATARGLAVSGDGGATWTFHADGLHAPYCRAVAVTAGAVLVSASVGPYGGRAALYRFADGTFERCERGLPGWFGDNLNTHCVAARGEEAAFGTSDGSVYVSDDAGRTWERAADGLGPVAAVLLGRFD